MSSALVMSDAKGSFSWALFRATACVLDNGHSDMSKPTLQILFLPDILIRDLYQSKQ